MGQPLGRYRFRDQRKAWVQLGQRLSKFSAIGLSGVWINMAVFSILVTQLHFHYLLASAAAVETALTSNYLLNNNWTFADRRAGFLSLAGLARYHTVALGGMLINLAVLQALVGGLGVQAMLANLAGIGVGTGWNFALNMLWTWRRPLQPAAVEAQSRREGGS